MDRKTRLLEKIKDAYADLEDLKESGDIEDILDASLALEDLKKEYKMLKKTGA